MENKKINKTSAAQLKASKKYQAKHKTEVYRIQKKSKAKNFIIKDATREELNYFQKLITERLLELKNDNDKQG